MAKPVRLRELAADDLDDATGYYLEHAGPQTTLEFVDAVERAFGWLGRNPRVGSLRFAHELDIPELRAVQIARFPYVAFYVDSPETIDVWRILHTRRDMPTTLRRPDE